MVYNIAGALLKLSLWMQKIRVIDRVSTCETGAAEMSPLQYL